jgi:hypothetical protein
LLDLRLASRFLMAELITRKSENFQAEAKVHSSRHEGPLAPAKVAFPCSTNSVSAAMEKYASPLPRCVTAAVVAIDLDLLNTRYAKYIK